MDFGFLIKRVTGDVRKAVYFRCSKSEPSFRYEITCTENAVCLSANASFQEACELLAQHKIDSVPLLDEMGRVVATLGRNDLLHATMKVYLDQKGLSMGAK